MEVKPEEHPKRIRKRRYIPNLAAAHFKPTEDWTIDDAKNRYLKAEFTFEVDTIIYEDCIKGMKSLPKESIDVIIADPPFGLNFTGKESVYNRDHRFVKGGYREVKGNYEEFSFKWMSELPRIMKKSGSAWIFSGWTNLGDVLNAVKKAGLTLVNDIVWKYQFGVFTERKFVTSHYHVLFLVKNSDYYFNKIMHYPLDVWEIHRTYRRGEVKNSTKLPEKVVMRCMDFASRPGFLVLDPFMGNGTTAAVAKGTYRHYLGFEINKSMEEVVGANLNSVKLGEFYTPYSDRHDDLVEKAKRRYASRLCQTRIL